MTARPPDSGDVFPRAHARRRYLSAIWLIPIIAIGLSAYLGARSYMEHGPRIALSMPSGDDLSPGQTAVKYKGVVLGTLETIDLKSDRSGVVLYTRMTAAAKPFLTDHARFWVVRPRLNTSLTNLQSLVSGIYIQMDPGPPGGTKTVNFKALDNPPDLLPDQPGAIYTLLAERLGPLGLGSIVYYRDIAAGEVTGIDAGKPGEPIKVKIFLRAPYDKYVRPDSLFWNDSGLSMTMGSTGVKVEVQSLQAVLAGAVAFETPAVPRAGVPQTAAFFPLYESKKAAEAATYTRRIPCVTYLHSAVKDLAPGSPVVLYGIAAGAVTDVHLMVDPQSGQPEVRVAFDIQPDLAFGTKETDPTQDAEKILLHLVQEGMRARLESRNLILGQEDLALEFTPQAEPVEIVMEGDALVLPGEGGGNLADSLSDVAGKLDQIPFDDIGKHLDHLVTSADQNFGSPDMKRAIEALEETLSNARDVSRTAKTNLTPALQKLPQISAQLQSAVTHANEMMTSINAGFGKDSDFNRTVKRVMDEVNDAARSIRLLADFLERHPEALLSGKKPEPETVPKSEVDPQPAEGGKP